MLKKKVSPFQKNNVDIVRKARWNEKKKGNGVSEKKKRYITQKVFGPLKEGFPIASQDRSHMSLSVPGELIVSIRLCHVQACTVHISPNHISLLSPLPSSTTGSLIIAVGSK